MRLKLQSVLGGVVFAGVLLSPLLSGAQQSTPASHSYSTYDVSRETTLVGTVLSYTAESSVPPVGAHVSIQTAAGAVDVHVGSAKLLQQSRVTLAAGDSVRITGEVIAAGQSSTFAARIIEDGTQSVTVRDTKGQVLQMPAVRVARGAR
jgi:hypothetical protein